MMTSMKIKDLISPKNKNKFEYLNFFIILMEGEKIFCEHFIDKNITKSVAGKKIYRDQCSKCYDDSVRNTIPI